MTVSYFSIPGIVDIPRVIRTTPITIKEIEDSVVDYTGIGLSKLHTKTRKTEVVFARHLIYYFSRLKTDLRLKKIGKYFGHDHTTVIHGWQRILDDLDVKVESTQLAVEAIEEMLDLGIWLNGASPLKMHKD